MAHYCQLKLPPLLPNLPTDIPDTDDTDDTDDISDISDIKANFVFAVFAVFRTCSRKGCKCNQKRVLTTAIFSTFGTFMAENKPFGDDNFAAIAATKPNFGNCTKNTSEVAEFDEFSERRSSLGRIKSRQCSYG